MKKNFKKKVLSNGMTILFEKRNLPVVSVVFAVKAGGINESEEEKGISHFIEHMLYKGTPSRNAKQIAEEIEKNGGELNGFTSEEITAYYCKISSKHFNTVLEVLADIVKNPLFDKKEMEKERKVIFEEIKLYKDNPRLHSFDEIQKSLYTGTMSINLAGTFETMGSIDRKKMIEKFKKTYTPNNMVLVVVGDADFNKIVEFVEKKFGNEKGKVPKQKFDLKNEKRIETRTGIDQANLVFAYHTPLSSDKRNNIARVLSCLMAGGMSSRLFDEIRGKRNLAYSVKGDSNINKDFSYNFIYAGTMKDNVEKVKKLILDEFKKVSKDLTEKELQQVKDQLIGNYQLSMEDSQSQMVNLLISEVHGKAEDFYSFEKDISEVKLKDVREMASKVEKSHSFFALVPSDD